MGTDGSRAHSKGATGDRSDAPVPHKSADRLDSWKEIASYLDRDVTTVQRWEKTEGLPVHRHRHLHVGSVYAFKSELDTWWNRDRSATSFQLTPSEGEPPTPPRRWRALVFGRGSSTPRTALVALAVVIAVIAAILVANRSSRVPRLRVSDPVQITAGTGVEGWATWSPDGRMLAYVSDESGNSDIWVTQLGGNGPAVNRTQDHDGVDMGPSWSPDGSQIAFRSVREGVPAIYVMSPLAGPPRRIAGSAFGAPQWSPDGRELAFLVQEAPRTTVEIVSLRDHSSRRLTLDLEADLSAQELKWSPDGRFFAYAVGAGMRALVARIWVLSLEEGKAIAITDGLNHDRDPMWAADGRSLFFVSDRLGGTDLWQQPLTPEGRPTGSPAAVTAGVGIRNAGLSRDGTKLAYTTGRLIANLWRIPILAGRRATWADAEQLTREQAFIEAIDLSPDGKQLLIGSDRGGNHDVWLAPVGGGPLVRVAGDPAAEWGPRWSPDGTQLVFYSYRSGNRDVWTTPVEGGAARQITSDASQDMWPNWLPDGKMVSFYSNRTGTRATYVAPKDGGEARLVIDDAEFAEWSPKGHQVMFLRPDAGVLWVAADTGAGARQLSHERMNVVARWSPDGSTIYTGRGTDLLAISPDDGRERVLTDLGDRRGVLGQFALATDGRYLYFTWDESVADLWMMTVTQETP